MTQMSASRTSRIWLPVRVRMPMKIDTCCDIKRVAKLTPKIRPRYLLRSPVSIRSAIQFMERTSNSAVGRYRPVGIYQRQKNLRPQTIQVVEQGVARFPEQLWVLGVLDGADDAGEGGHKEGRALHGRSVLPPRSRLDAVGKGGLEGQPPCRVNLLQPLAKPLIQRGHFLREVVHGTALSQGYAGTR